MKRILFYTDTPNYGGAERQMELLARHLKPLGYEVSLAYGMYSKLAEKQDEMKGAYAKTYLLPVLHKHDPRHYHYLKQLLRDEKFDLLHVHLWNPGACRYAFWAGHHAKTPIVTTEHDPFELGGLKRMIQRHTLRKTDAIIAISSDNFGQMGKLVEHVKTPVYLSNNGIEVGPFLDNHDKASLQMPIGSIVLTCVAELHPRKGHKFLIEAFQRLQKEIPLLQLVLVGNGPIEKDLKERYGANPNLHFLGWRKDIPQILRATDVFVLPSLREAFGLSVVEAMASGVPVVATETSGTKDIIENGKSGLLVPPGDSVSLEQAIHTLLNNPGQRADLAKNGLERAKTLFTAERMAKTTADVYETVLKVSRE
jgi:glycosyltransferase involved in cell wall biosynthesis